MTSAWVTCGSFSNTSSPAPAMRLACERLDQGRLVHHVAAGGVDQERVGPHQREALAVHQVPGLGRRGTVQRDEVGLPQHLLERWHAAPRRATWATSGDGGYGSWKMTFIPNP